MFLTTNNEVIGSLKSPPAMVFHRKRTVRASASRLLLSLVSSYLGKKQLFHSFLRSPRATVHRVFHSAEGV